MINVTEFRRGWGHSLDLKSGRRAISDPNRARFGRNQHLAEARASDAGPDSSIGGAGARRWTFPDRFGDNRQDVPAPPGYMSARALAAIGEGRKH
jgi:hypothetical protein